MNASRSQRIGHPLIIGLWGVTLFGAMAWALLSGGPQRGVASDDVRVNVRTVVFDHGSNAPVVVLQSADHERALPIWVGSFEAQAIAMQMQGVSGPRPLTHDLLTTIIKELEAEVERVVIEDLRESTYYATIHLRSHGSRVQIDSRPSDAIALALRLESPIFVAAALMTGEAAISLTPGEGAVSAGAAGVTQLWGLTLQDVSAELAEFFASGNGRGVLVSDVAPGAVADGVQRGDLIVELNGDTVGSVADLMTRARGLHGGSPVHLGLGRQGASLQVRFASDTP
jgi:bifunctional DNase/RNase